MKPVLPDAALAHHTAVLGKTGSGKTSTAKLIVEHVSRDARVCVLDPIKSDWWGLTASADGKKAGLPFHILGGPRGHVPLHANAGKAIAEVVASGALRHSIIDMADFGAGDHLRFFVPFAETLFRRVHGVIYLVIEEAHLFAPKERGGQDGPENMAIHWMKRLGTAARTKGIRLIVCTQRMQELHNAVLGSCETAIVHRITLPDDQTPVLKWLRGHLGKDKAAEIGAGMGSFKTGTGWVCSGEAQIVEYREFPRIRTFDNTATPSGDDAALDVKTAPVDADKLRSIIGDAVKEAEANDPAKLKAEIRRLSTELAKKPEGAPSAEQIAAAEARGFTNGRDTILRQFKQMTGEALYSCQAAGSQLQGTLGTLKAMEQTIATAPKAAPQAGSSRAPVLGQASTLGRPPAAAAQVPEGAKALAAAQRKILNALAFLEQVGIAPTDKTQVALFADLSPTAGHTQNMFGGLKNAEPPLVEYPVPGQVQLTTEGRALADPGRVPQTASEMQAILLAKVAAAQRKLLAVLIEVYPESIDKRECAERAGLSPDAGHTQNMYGGLRSMGVIEYPTPGKAVALPILFLEAR